MSLYIVTWNLNKEGANYNRTRELFLRGFAGLDCRYAGTRLDTVVLVSTGLTASQLYDRLIAPLDTNDRIFISRMDPSDHRGYLDQETADWLNARIRLMRTRS
jgi:hypothetical protein